MAVAACGSTDSWAWSADGQRECSSDECSKAPGSSSVAASAQVGWRASPCGWSAEWPQRGFGAVGLRVPHSAAYRRRGLPYLALRLPVQVLGVRDQDGAVLLPQFGGRCVLTQAREREPGALFDEVQRHEVGVESSRKARSSMRSRSWDKTKLLNRSCPSIR